MNRIFKLRVLLTFSSIQYTKPITQDKNVPLRKAFADSCQLLQLCHPTDVVGDVVHDSGNEVPPLLSLSCLDSLLDDVVPYWRQIVPSTTLFGLGFRTIMYMTSFTPLSNHLDSVIKISVFSNSMKC